ncbi:serine O-acetyltransferase [Paracraurococcus lichenis]|uniref:Serine acetyltransferase n=1 Tax=Paracraurococcus lichenis TaxID=3064888 RepID=A0ABT9E2S0_9PROT|nr:hypothetical protein [Paracraurococcus sp. LOR1-02]MDO9710390.1 hypothetical protein [Paracraurococcus sp. LOR1-02]
MRVWMREYLEDVDRYRRYCPNISRLALIVLNQGLWALLQYRIAHSLYASRLPPTIKGALLVLCVIWQKVVEISTGIEIPYRATIGPGFYIGHFGNIILHPDVIIGKMCNISQGVTLGISGRGERRGVPVLGDRVYLGANAILAGKLEVGDDAVIAANSLITRDVPQKAVMVGNPAQIVSYKGSADYLSA